MCSHRAAASKLESLYTPSPHLRPPLALDSRPRSHDLRVGDLSPILPARRVALGRSSESAGAYYRYTS